MQADPKSKKPRAARRSPVGDYTGADIDGGSAPPLSKAERRTNMRKLLGGDPRAMMEEEAAEGEGFSHGGKVRGCGAARRGLTKGKMR